MNRFVLIFLFSALFLVSCDKKEEGISDELILEVNNPFGQQLITDYDIPFEAKLRTGNDLTNSAVFYIDGQAQNGHVLQFSQPGTHQVSAGITLDGQTLTSANYEVNVITPRHSTKVLVEDYTGTWCTNCPRVAYKLEQAVSQNDHIIPVGIHQSRYPGDDPFGFDQVTDLISDYNISGLPSPVVNRTLGFIWDENYSTLEAELNKSQPLGMSISSSVSGTDLSIDVSVRFDMDMSKQDLQLVLYLTENGLHADQANATSYYGGQDPIPDFEQKHVLRAALNGLYGATLSSSNTGADQTFTYHLSVSVPSQVTDINNCDIEAFVINGNDQNAKFINIQKAAVGTTKDFD